MESGQHMCKAFVSINVFARPDAKFSGASRPTRERKKHMQWRHAETSSSLANAEVPCSKVM